jgi:hypothetical protein
VDAIEPLKRIESCPLGLKSHASTLCPLHAKIDRAIAATEKIFRETTIAELLSTTDSTPLCEGRKLIPLSLSPEGQSNPKPAAHKA